MITTEEQARRAHWHQCSQCGINLYRSDDRGAYCDQAVDHRLDTGRCEACWAAAGDLQALVWSIDAGEIDERTETCAQP